MKKNMALLIMALLLCCTFSGMVVANEDSRLVAAAAAEEGEKVVKISGDDWGYPTPFAHYPRGPGYIRTSFMFDTLTWKDEDGVISWLADTWSQSYDAKVWTFYLHPEVKWSDGEPFTADDVKFTFDYVKEHPTSWYDAEEVDQVEVLDPYKVSIHLKESRPAFIEDVAGSVMIIPEHIWKDVTDPNEFRGDEALTGTGPLKLVKYVPEQGYYEYEANPECFEGEPLIDRLISMKVNDDTLALKAGDIDAASFSAEEVVAVDKFKNDPKFDIIDGPNFWVRKFYFHCDEYPTNIKEFRQALAYGIDREGLVKNVLHDGAIVANPGIIHPDSKWYKPGLPGYEYNTVIANEMLDELNFTDTDGNGVRNYPGGEDIVFVLLTNAEEDAEFIHDNLEAIGIKTEVKAMSNQELDPILKSGNFNIAISGHGGIVKPTTFESPFYGTYQNDEYDELYQKQLKTMYEDTRMRYVGDLQTIIAEDLPLYTLYHPNMWQVYNPDKLDTWFYTQDGVATGIPIAENKLIFLFDPWRYDASGDGIIDKNEVVDAIQDFFDHKITKEQAIEVIGLYFL
jgi:peptide/nickel transport system substrate-binding protein